MKRLEVAEEDIISFHSESPYSDVWASVGAPLFPTQNYPQINLHSASVIFFLWFFFLPMFKAISYRKKAEFFTQNVFIPRMLYPNLCECTPCVFLLILQKWKHFSKQRHQLQDMTSVARKPGRLIPVGAISVTYFILIKRRVWMEKAIFLWHS